jgi:diketogulonate reductase-like aldo/keto reductase
MSSSSQVRAHNAAQGAGTQHSELKFSPGRVYTHQLESTFPAASIVETFTSAAGIRMPRIIYGTAWKKSDTARLVATALRRGFRGIDTACQPKHYEEGGVGEGLAATSGAGLARDDLYLQTKFTPLSGHDPGRIPYNPRATVAEQVAQSFEVSLRNLRTDRLDCLVLHSPLPTPAQTHEVWQAMEARMDSGQVGQLGISNCYQLRQLQALHTAARIKPAVLQNRFCAETRYDRDIRVFCRQNGIVYQSFWTLTANPHILSHRAVVALAEKYQRTTAQILFRYLTQIGVAPLTGTRSEAHMRDDLAIFEFELTEPERAQVDASLH